MLQLSKPGGLALSLAANENTEDYLSKELKLGLRHEQEKSALGALKNPEAWVAARFERIGKLIPGIASDFDDTFDEYKKYLPLDEALAYATRDAQATFERKMRLEELVYPGSNLLLPRAFADSAKTVAEGRDYASVISGASTGDDRREQYKTLRREHKEEKRVEKEKKRAKKDKKRAKKERK